MEPASLPTQGFRSMGTAEPFPTLVIDWACIKEKNILISTGGYGGASTHIPGVGKGETSLSLQSRCGKARAALLSHSQEEGVLGLRRGFLPGLHTALH